MYTASIEVVCEHCLILRLHETPYTKYLEPYVWCTTIKLHKGGIIEFKGADKPIPRSGAGKAIVNALKEMGFLERFHERPHGRRVTKRI